MQFIDHTKVLLKAGKGGDGLVSFRREAHVPLGGPFGGDGGNGGSIIFKVNSGKSTLLDLHFKQKIVAQNGENGLTKKMHGASGLDTIIEVPLGTVVKNAETKKIIADLTSTNQQAIIAKGGKGGWGNYHFKTSKNTAPEYAEKGEPGESFEAEIELKLLADVGLVGFPSVGKSTILSVVSAAKPEIADYPFTTLVPNLGMVKVGDGRSFVMADLPGLIKGASLGKGLGHEFLRHIERCRVIIHVLDMSDNGRDVIEDYKIINEELKSYNLKLMERPQIIVANKMDDDCAHDNLERFKKAYPNLEIFETISLINEGLQKVLYKAADLLDVTDYFPLQDDNDNVGVVYKYQAPQQEFTILNLGNGKWSLQSTKISRLLENTNFNDEEQTIRFGLILRKMGVDQQLIDKGAQPDDTVYINDYVFELTELL